MDDPTDPLQSVEFNALPYSIRASIKKTMADSVRKANAFETVIVISRKMAATGDASAKYIHDLGIEALTFKHDG